MTFLSDGRLSKRNFRLIRSELPGGYDRDEFLFFAHCKNLFSDNPVAFLFFAAGDHPPGTGSFFGRLRSRRVGMRRPEKCAPSPLGNHTRKGR